MRVFLTSFIPPPPPSPSFSMMQTSYTMFSAHICGLLLIFTRPCWSSLRSFKDVQRYWPAVELESQTRKSGFRQSIMEEFLRCLHVRLYDRLKHHDTIRETIVSLQDSFGSDLSLQAGTVLQIIQALVAFFLHDDCFSHLFFAWQCALRESSRRYLALT